MSELDDKLDDLAIWIEANRDTPPQRWNDDIWPTIKTLIKQAFTEAGYVKVPVVELESDPTNTRPTIYTVMGKEVVTAAEFYDRLDHELERLGKEKQISRRTYDMVSAAGKRAAGIKYD